MIHSKEKLNKIRSVDIKVFLSPWWKKIFCNHEWIEIGVCRIFAGIEEQKTSLPTDVYMRFLCKKCGKEAKKEI
jgi:hypothetical protein